jgi:excisionase family DNA binding protein
MDLRGSLPDKPYLKTAEVAAAFGVDQSTVFLWTRKGRLRPIRTPGGTFRFARDEVAKLLLPAQAATTERRHEPRYPVNWPVILHTVSDGLLSSYEADVRDVSAGGMGLVVHHLKMPRKSVSINDNDRVTVINSSVSSLKPEIPAQVRFCRRLSETDVAIGVAVG